MGILFFLIITLFICLTPVYSFTKSKSKTFIICCFLSLFLLLHRGIFLKERFFYHDTFWNGEILFRILAQWTQNGFYLGWNPFINAGEPIYLFSNNWIKAPYLLFCLLNNFIHVDTHILFTLVFVFIFLNFFTGCFLLFMALFDNFITSLFCFACIALSGFFYINTGQSATITLLYFLPFILLGLIYGIKHNSAWGVGLALIYTNIYNVYFILLCNFAFYF